MKFLKQALIFLFNIIYPPCCIICGKITEGVYCKECKDKLFQKCEIKIDSKFSGKLYFEYHIYFFMYKDIIRNLILDYKFRDKSYLYKFFSEIIIKNEKICRILKSYDIIIPVPIHTKRKRERGYNQSELIAIELASQIENIKIENHAILKKINNKKQSTLAKEERKQNVQNVYEITNSEKIKNKRIILFDDIYTTGNTVNEISKLLKQSGAKEILVLTIAKD